MKTIQEKFRSLVRRLTTDEQGAEVLEFVIVVGLIIVGAIVAISAFGTKVLARWTSINSSMT